MNLPPAPAAPVKRPRHWRPPLIASLILSILTTPVAMIAPHCPNFLARLVLLGFPGIVITSFIPTWTDGIFFLFAIVVNCFIYFPFVFGLYKLWKLFSR